MLNQRLHVLAGNAQARWNHQRCCQCSINDFTYILKMHKQDGIVRGTVSAQSTTSHTYWKCTSKMEPSEARSVFNQQVHVLPGNAQARWNCQICGQLNQQVHVQSGNVQARWNRQTRGQCSINKFTYLLEMRKRGELSEHGQCLINKFTYTLDMRKQDGAVRIMVPNASIYLFDWHNPNIAEIRNGQILRRWSIRMYCCIRPTEAPFATPTRMQGP